MGDLLLRRHWALRSRGVGIVGVTRRATQPVLGRIHGETGGGGGAAGRGMGNKAVSGRWSKGGCAWLLRDRNVVSGSYALGTKAEPFES